MTPQEQAIVTALLDGVGRPGLLSFDVILPNQGGGVIGWKWRSKDGRMFGDNRRFDPAQPLDEIIAIGRAALEQAEMTQRIARGERRRYTYHTTHNLYDGGVS